MHEPVDPTNATNPDVSRRAFVELSVVTAAGVAATPHAVAQTAALGQTHPPLVAEDDPSIDAEVVTLHTANGDIDAYAARPKNAGPETPGVVVIMHIWGVDTQIRDVVRRYAKAGFAAIAPNLYARFGAPSGDGVTDSSVFRKYPAQFEQPKLDDDVREAAMWLKTAAHKSKIGITGFCMGGHLALVQAITNSDIFSAVAPFYGNPEGVDSAKIRIPVCGSYGARDTGIPAASVEAFAAALHVPNDVKIYPDAGHAFFDDQRKAYVASAAEDAWNRTIAFFTKYGGQPA